MKKILLFLTLFLFNSRNNIFAALPPSTVEIIVGWDLGTSVADKINTRTLLGAIKLDEITMGPLEFELLRVNFPITVTIGAGSFVYNNPNDIRNNGNGASQLRIRSVDENRDVRKPAGEQMPSEPTSPQSPTLPPASIRNLGNLTSPGCTINFGCTQGNNAIIIADLDTGLDVTHAFFVSNGFLWVNNNEIPGDGLDNDGNGYKDDVNGANTFNVSASFVPSFNGNITDQNGHGTHTAGIIGQCITPSAVGVSAVKIMAVKVFDAAGNGKLWNLVRGIAYAFSNGAKIVNLSLGWTDPWLAANYGTPGLAGVPIEDMINFGNGATAGTGDMLFINAAGNDFKTVNAPSDVFPGRFVSSNLIVVASTTCFGQFAFTYSNFGNVNVDIAALGRINSTLPNGITPAFTANTFGIMTGTSQACALISGAAALVASKTPYSWLSTKNFILSNFRLEPTLMGRCTTNGEFSINGLCATLPPSMAFAPDMPSSINEVENNYLEEGIFPNPTSDFTNLSLNIKNDNTNVIISVFNLQGQQLMSSNNLLNAGNTHIKLDFSPLELPKGMYYIRVLNGDKVSSYPIVIE